MGYVIGSIPFGLIAGRLSRGVDVREYGSGKIGMTNVLRTVGIKAAGAVLILDFSKSVIAILVIRIFTDSPIHDIAVGLASMIGHNWPIFVGFKGGRGIATGWGVLFILHPISGAVAAAVGIPIAGLTKLMSLASILGAGAGCITLAILALTGLTALEHIFFALIGFPFILVRHTDNIMRIIRGEERKIEMKSNRTKKKQSGRGLRWPKSA